ncbi:MAG TPA: hypothetical protein VHB77_05105 [Planctomycetaceae bacterium]|nr:hypothetical protein [Planctomycetaceae bacterium]
MAQIEDWAIIAQPLRVGFTWTLVSRLGEMLKEIEALLGPRDQSFTLLGIEFQAEGPQLWFPLAHEGRKDVVIQLSTATLTNSALGLCELAHEAVHLLNPRAEGISTLEEGLAVWFQRRYTSTHFQLKVHQRSEAHDRACGLVEKLISHGTDRLSRLRPQGASLSEVVAAQIQSTWPEVPLELAEALARPFDADD